MPATDLPAEEIIASCSFCGKPSTKVQKLVAGPGVFICDECIDLSATIIAETADSTPEESARRRDAFVNRSADDLLAALPALAAPPPAPSRLLRRPEPPGPARVAPRAEKVPA